MGRLIIHIGTQKTGTSALQYYFTKMRDRLSEVGCCYPQSGILTNQIAHHLLFHLIKKNDKLRLEQELAKIVEESKSYQQTVISSESFQNIKTTDHFLPLLEHFSDITTVCYFREDLDFLQSAYRQKVHANPTYKDSFKVFLKKKNINYSRIHQMWGDISSAFEVRCYDRRLFPDQSVVADFVYNILELEDLEVNVLNRNSSIGGVLLYYKLYRNKMGQASPDDYNILSQLAAQHPHFRLPLYIDKKVQKAYRDKSDNNDWLFTQFPHMETKDFSRSDYRQLQNTLSSDLDLLEEGFGIAIDKRKLSDFISDQLS